MIVLLLHTQTSCPTHTMCLAPKIMTAACGNYCLNKLVAKTKPKKIISC